MTSNEIKIIKGFIQILKRHEILPDESGQAVIERVGNSRDPSALPTLKEALKTCIEYEKWAESLPDLPGLWIYRVLASKMESRLRLAIEYCTPEGGHIPDEKK